MPDEFRPSSGHSARENILAIMLSVMVLGAFAVFLIVVTGGLLLQILGIVILGVIVGWVHYRLWGRSLIRNTEGEREEAELRAKLETEPWDDSPFGPRNE